MGKWGAGVKGSVRGKLQEIFFFFFFLSATYSRVFKKKKHSYRLPIAAFLKNAAIGQRVSTILREL